MIYLFAWGEVQIVIYSPMCGMFTRYVHKVRVGEVFQVERSSKETFLDSMLDYEKSEASDIVM